MEKLKAALQGRPIWMNALFVFCAYMTFIYMPFDMFIKPVAEDEEIWFGFVLHGWAAKATEPIHWAIYGAGFYGFLHMKPWMHPWAAVYVVQVAIAMAVFPWLNQGAPIYAGLIVAVPFVILAVMLIRAKDTFDGNRAVAVTPDAQEIPEAESDTNNQKD